MARYIKEIPVNNDPGVAVNQAVGYLASQGFQYRQRNAEMVYQKGDGFWVAAGFIKVTHYGNVYRVEAWVDAFGSEQNLEGFVAIAAKKPLKKHAEQVERILAAPAVCYAPVQPAAPAQPAAPVQPAVPSAEGTFCARCGTPVPAGGNFCPRCANPVHRG